MNELTNISVEEIINTHSCLTITNNAITNPTSNNNNNTNNTINNINNNNHLLNKTTNIHNDILEKNNSKDKFVSYLLSQTEMSKMFNTNLTSKTSNKNIHELKCDDYNIIKISKNFFYNYPNLQLISLKNNKLKKISKHFLYFANLTQMFFDNNEITYIPTWIHNFKHLNTLSLSFNYIEYFPLNLTKLNSLQTLNIAYNKIKAIPFEIMNLSKLKTLFFNSNYFEELPTSLGIMNSLNKITLEWFEFVDLNEIIKPKQSIIANVNGVLFGNNDLQKMNNNNSSGNCDNTINTNPNRNSSDCERNNYQMKHGKSAYHQMAGNNNNNNNGNNDGNSNNNNNNVNSNNNVVDNEILNTSEFNTNAINKEYEIIVVYKKLMEHLLNKNNQLFCSFIDFLSELRNNVELIQNTRNELQKLQNVTITSINKNNNNNGNSNPATVFINTVNQTGINSISDNQKQLSELQNEIPGSEANVNLNINVEHISEHTQCPINNTNTTNTNINSTTPPPPLITKDKLFHCVKMNYYGIILSYIHHNPDYIKIKTETNRTLLYTSFSTSYSDITKLLLENCDLKSLMNAQYYLFKSIKLQNYHLFTILSEKLPISTFSQSDVNNNNCFHILFNTFYKNTIASYHMGEILIRKTNCDVNQKNKLGWAPVHIAVKKGRLEALNFIQRCNIWLEQHGKTKVDYNKKGKGKWTALHLAVNDYKIHEAIFLIRGVGASMFIKNENGFTARGVSDGNYLLSRFLIKEEQDIYERKYCKGEKGLTITKQKKPKQTQLNKNFQIGCYKMHLFNLIKENRRDKLESEVCDLLENLYHEIEYNVQEKIILIDDICEFVVIYRLYGVCHVLDKIKELYTNVSGIKNTIENTLKIISEFKYNNMNSKWYTFNMQILQRIPNVHIAPLYNPGNSTMTANITGMHHHHNIIITDNIEITEQNGNEGGQNDN